MKRYSVLRTTWGWRRQKILKLQPQTKCFCSQLNKKKHVLVLVHKLLKLCRNINELPSSVSYQVSIDHPPKRKLVGYTIKFMCQIQSDILQSWFWNHFKRSWATSHAVFRISFHKSNHFDNQIWTWANNIISDKSKRLHGFQLCIEFCFSNCELGTPRFLLGCYETMVW